MLNFSLVFAVIKVFRSFSRVAGFPAGFFVVLTMVLFHVDLPCKSKSLIGRRFLQLINVTKNTSFQDLLFRLPTLDAYKSWISPFTKQDWSLIFQRPQSWSHSNFSVFVSFSYESFSHFCIAHSIFSCADVVCKNALERDRDTKEMLDGSRTFAEKNLRALVGGLKTASILWDNIFLFITIGSCFKCFVDCNIFINQFCIGWKRKRGYSVGTVAFCSLFSRSSLAKFKQTLTRIRSTRLES